MQTLQSLLHYNLTQYWNIRLKAYVCFSGCTKGICLPFMTKLNKPFDVPIITFLCPLSPGSWYDLNSCFWQCWPLLEEPDKCATIMSIFCHIGWFWSGECGSCSRDFLEFNNMGIDISNFPIRYYYNTFNLILTYFRKDPGNDGYWEESIELSARSVYCECIYKFYFWVWPINHIITKLPVDLCCKQFYIRFKKQ